MDAFIQLLKDMQPWLTAVIVAGWTVTTWVLTHRQKKNLQKQQHAHELDFQKRKYRYETRRDEYLRFLRTIEDINKEANKSFDMSALFEGFPSSGNQEEALAFLEALPNRTLKYMEERGDLVARLKTETLAIRLVADDELLSLLDLYESQSEAAINAGLSFIQNLPQKAMSGELSGTIDDVIDPSLLSNLKETYENIQKNMRESLKEL